MDESQKIYIVFNTDNMAKSSIVVDNAKDDITASQITNAQETGVADLILASGIFAKITDEGEDAFASLESCYYLRTQVTPLEPDDPETAKKFGKLSVKGVA